MCPEGAAERQEVPAAAGDLCSQPVELPDVGAAEAVDRLLRVTDQEEMRRIRVGRIADEELDQQGLQRVRVLHLIDHQVADPLAQVEDHARVVPKQPHRLDLEVEEVQGALLPFCLAVALAGVPEDRAELPDHPQGEVVVLVPGGQRGDLTRRLPDRTQLVTHLCRIGRPCPFAPARHSQRAGSGQPLAPVLPVAGQRIAEPGEELIELRAPSPEGGGEISMRDLLKNALRMRPDRIVVGEVRGAEALEAMQAMNTGHPGSMVTVHANSSRDAISRLEYLVMMGSGEMPLSAIRNQVISAVDLVVHASRFSNGKRRVVAITDVVGLEGDVPVLENIWSYDPGSDRFACSGSRPSFAARVEDAGFGDLLTASMAAARQGLSIS